MLLFLATVIEQLDLALEHVSKGDVHNARFGLMLTDNAIELVLHQIAVGQASELKAFSYLREKYAHAAALEKALGRSFEDKVKFAKLEGNLSDEVAQTVSIMHGFRNEVYHVGLRHEPILPAVAVFYFEAACTYLARYEPRFIGWGSNQKLPERAAKYFQGHHSMPGERDDFGKACRKLAKASGHDSAHTIATLADHLDSVIEDQDTCIDIIATGVYEGQQTTREGAVKDTQAWALAFSEKGKAFAQERGFSGNMLQLVAWLAENYPFSARKDPIPSWRKQVASLRELHSAHKALAHYHSFMRSTAALRDALSESASAAEAEIDAAVDRARGK